MKPSEICTKVLGRDRLVAVLGELSSPQIKAVLKNGDLHVKLPGGYVSQQKRRALWTEKICAGVERENDELAGELLQQWLLNHRRIMLIEYLDRLQVKHRQGETDDSFLVTGSTEKVREAATWLLGRHDRVEASAYLAYIAFQQRSKVFEGWDGLSLGEAAPADAAPAPETSAPAATTAAPETSAATTPPPSSAPAAAPPRE